MKFDTKQKLLRQLSHLSPERAASRADRLEELVDGIAWETMPTTAGYWVSPRGTVLAFGDEPGKDPSEATLRLSGPWMELGVDANLHCSCEDELESARIHGAELERRVLAAHHALNGSI